MSVVVVTPTRVEELLARGMDADEVVRLLVATGAWSESGAAEIVSTLGQRDDQPALDPWPGPIEEPGPLFAT